MTAAFHSPTEEARRLCAHPRAVSERVARGIPEVTAAPAGGDATGWPRPQRGQSLVELALTLPMLMMIVMGIIDLGFVLYAHVQVAAAAYEGARAGSLFMGDNTFLISDNDQNRADAVRKAVYDPYAGTSSLGLLKTTDSAIFSVGTDVTVAYPNPATDPINNSRRAGEEIVVTVRYRQPLWFDFLPGAVSNRLEVSSSTHMVVQ